MSFRPRASGLARALTLGFCFFAFTGYSCERDGARTGVGQWLEWGGNLHNTHSAEAETKITTATVRTLTPKWTFTTLGNVTSVPTVKDGVAYFMDWGTPLPGLPGGFVRAVDAQTGNEIWSRPITFYTGSLIRNVARTSPTLFGDLLIFGDNRNTIATALDLGTSGASLYAVNKNTGDLVWKTKLEDHPLSVVTQSPVVYNGNIYVGVSSVEEGAARLGYACCTFRGSMMSLDAATGRVLWKTYTIPDTFGQTGHFSGGAVWGSSPAIDEDRKVVYVATGNNYTLSTALQKCVDAHRGDPAAQQTLCYGPLDAKDNYAFSVLALDLQSGSIRWVNKLRNWGAWNLACDTGLSSIIPNNPANCQDLDGEDYDFGMAPMLYTAKTSPNSARDMVGVGQKSGVFWALNPDDGSVIWNTQVGPGGTLGGMEWGAATDGERIYAAISNFDHKPYTLANGQVVQGGFWSALDAATGKVIWQTPDPSSNLPQSGLIPSLYWGFKGPGFYGVALGPISISNGLVFAGSMDKEGHMYAFDSHTGSILWSYASGGSVNGAPAIVDGVLYWGSGSDKGFSNNKFYAFGLPR